MASAWASTAAFSPASLALRVSALEATIGELQSALDRLTPMVETVSDKLDRRVKKHKEKLTDHHVQEGLKAKLT
jgi:ribosome-associated translation inhibitor RaiA